MKAKYTHKFIIYDKKKIKNNYNGLVEELANFDKEAIPNDFLETLMEHSKLFRERRQEFYHAHPSNMCTIDEILPYSQEINIETNKVLAFVQKYGEFSHLISAIDYFDGEDEYIEKYYSIDDPAYFGGLYPELYIKTVLRYYYGLSGNALNIFLKEIGLEEII